MTRKELRGLCENYTKDTLMDDELFQEIISSALKLDELDADKLARLIDVSRPSVERWSQGVSKPHSVMRRLAFREIAKALK